jgi:hypothetical protein
MNQEKIKCPKCGYLNMNRIEWTSFDFEKHKHDSVIIIKCRHFEFRITRLDELTKGNTVTITEGSLDY